MSIVKQQTPYEFLVRWTNGAVAGAHIRFLERLAEDGVVISEKEGHAQPVSLAGETGFPISDVLDVVQVSALSDLKTAQDALAASESKVAQLQAQIDAYTPPVPAKTVAVVSMRQARLALNAAGLLDAVEAAVASSTKDVQIEWEFSSELRRDWPTLVLLAGALNLTESQLDGLFIQASQL